MSDIDDYNERQAPAIFDAIEKEADTLSQFFLDPFSDITKSTRRNLLLTALISIIVATTGLLPKKISALGLELQDIDQMSFLIILALTVLYFVTTFLFYTYSDLVRAFWRPIYFFRVAPPEIEKTAMYIQHSARAFPKDNLQSTKYAIKVADLESIAKEARQAARKIERLHEKLDPTFKDLKWSNVRRVLKRIHVIRILVVDTALPLMVGLVSIGFLINEILNR